MGSREKRHKEFRDVMMGGAWMTLSGDLVESGAALLKLALLDRCRRVVKRRDDHYTFHGPGSIVVCVTALEAWVNEAIALAGPKLSEVLRPLADRPLSQRYGRLIREFSDSLPPGVPDGVSLACEVRHEIAHFLPRGGGPADELPDACAKLQERGILLTGRDDDAGYTLRHKLSGFKLAHWVAREVAAAVETLAAAVKPEFEHAVSTGVNFRELARLIGPERLPEFDREHRIELERKD